MFLARFMIPGLFPVDQVLKYNQEEIVYLHNIYGSIASMGKILLCPSLL